MSQPTKFLTPTPKHRSLTIGGLPTIVATIDGLVNLMVGDCLAARGDQQMPKLVFSSNGHAVALAGRNQWFRELLSKADIVHADGMSIVFASRILSHDPLPERICTTDFFDAAARRAGSENLRFYFLGGEPNVSAKALAECKRKYPGVTWVGARHGFFSPIEEIEICNEIKSLGTDVLWLGLGRPRQEAFAFENRGRLRGVGWIKTCGGLFDVLSGRRPRAPVWMQRSGLEWLWRMSLEPSRLSIRYLLTNLDAAWRLKLYTERKAK